jgi:hypothetical protein
MAIDQDTIKHLEDVKKGKPRHFVMICKGVKIVSLIIYKKGTVERYKKQAKEEGTGLFFHGVIDGKGESIVFNLLRSDGYESPPGKDLILKDFLNTESGIRFKPVYRIVDVLPEVGVGDDDTANFEVTYEAAGQSSELKAPPPVGAAAIGERLKTLAPHLKKAQALETSVSADLKQRASEVQAYARQREYVQAGLQLDQLEVLISQAFAEAAQRDDASSDSASKAATEEESANIKNALSKLASDIKAAVSKFPEHRAQLTALVARIQAGLKSGDIGSAKLALSDIAAMLDDLNQSLKNGFSLFKFSKARVEWLSTRDSAIADMRTLKLAVSDRFTNDEARQQPLTAALETLDDLIGHIDGAIRDDLDAVLNADEQIRPPLIERVRTEIEQLLVFLGSDPVMQAIDNNEVIPNMLVCDPLEAKLNDIVSALG